jgi:replication-associated recombination protein RarA
MKTKVINLFGGPGTGKSTTAAALFAELKFRSHLLKTIYSSSHQHHGTRILRTSQLGLSCSDCGNIRDLLGNPEALSVSATIKFVSS